MPYSESLENIHEINFDDEIEKLSIFDPLTGEVCWHNPLKGFVTGLATIATEQNPRSGTGSVLAEKRRRDEEAAASAAVVAAG